MIKIWPHFADVVLEHFEIIKCLLRINIIIFSSRESKNAEKNILYMGICGVYSITYDYEIYKSSVFEIRNKMEKGSTCKNKTPLQCLPHHDLILRELTKFDNSTHFI